MVDVAGAVLDGESLALLLSNQSRAPDAVSLNIMLSSWIDEALLATAMRDGQSLDDSTTVDSVIAPSAAQGAITEFLAKRAASLPPPTDAQVDSLADEGRVRVFQQIALRRPPESDTTADRAVARRGMDLQRQLLRGDSFVNLARRASEDPVSRARGGFLLPVTQDQVDAGMRPMIWSLLPGRISSLMGSEKAFFLFRRATLAESRESLRAWLAPHLTKAANNRFIDSLVRSRNVKIHSDAETRFRQIAREPVIAGDSMPLASWSGGRLSPADVRTWVLTFPPAERAAFANSSRLSGTKSIEVLIERMILLSLAAPSGPITPAAKAALVPTYRAYLDTVRRYLNRYGGEGRVAERASSVLDSAFVSNRPLRPLPGALNAVLRQRYPVRVDALLATKALRVAEVAYARNHRADNPMGPAAQP